MRGGKGRGGGQSSVPCQPQFAGGMGGGGGGRGASPVDGASSPAVNCHLKIIKRRLVRARRPGSTLEKLRAAGAAGGCCAMGARTRLRVVLMLMWIFQGKPINPPCARVSHARRHVLRRYKESDDFA